MEITKIVQSINRKLAGETLIYSELEVYLDSVVDEINARLNAKFPVFSEFNAVDHPSYPDYNFFPEKYVRTVVVTGATDKFYTQDAEGMLTSPVFNMEYLQNMFFMERDYISLVPLLYQVGTEQGILGEDEPTQERGLEVYGDAI